jgi:hypothetical protein
VPLVAYCRGRWRVPSMLRSLQVLSITRHHRRSFCSVGGMLVALIASTALAGGCRSSNANSARLGDLRDADAPYYYVGPTFDGFKVSHVLRYRGGQADILYGTCDAPDDGGCGLPLELQHRLCHGRVTVSIFVGQGHKRGSAHRAAAALRPLSRGARSQKPNVVFDIGSYCSPTSPPPRLSGAMTWDQARRLLRECRVRAIGQTHRRFVTLTLRSGERATTREPRIDDIFRILARLPRKCAPKTVSTE